jgi:hypothetical protein
MIQESYSNHNFNTEFEPEKFKLKVKAWHIVFKDITLQDAFTAFGVWLATERKMPTAADLNLIVRKNKNPESFISPELAWEQVTDAVRKFGWCNMERARTYLSEPIWRAVQNVGGWQKICKTELGQPWDFLRKNFIQAFEDFGENQQSQASMPDNVWKKLQDLNNQKCLENKADESEENDNDVSEM